jgi:hypothetical protein
MNAAEFLFAGVKAPAKPGGRDLRAQGLHAQDLHTRDVLHPP